MNPFPLPIPPLWQPLPVFHNGPNEPEMAKPSDQANEGVRRHKGPELFFTLLGGLLVVYLVEKYDVFLEFLRIGSTVGADTPSTACILLAYAGYVLNVFRQVHGLAIAVTDERYVAQVGKNEGIIENARSHLGLIAVLGIPCILVVWIDNVVRSLHTAEPIHAESYQIVLAYFFTALAYIVWDITTLKTIADSEKKDLCLWHRSKAKTKNKKLAVFHMTRNADCYAKYTQNWISLLSVVGISSVLLFLFIVCKFSTTVISLSVNHGTPVDVSLSALSLSRSWIPFILAILTFGYTIADYTLNRHFYFSPNK